MAGVLDDLRRLVRAGQLFAAWQLMYRRHADTLRRFVARRTRADRELCRDIWNDVYQELSVYAFTPMPIPWLLEVARRRIDRQRKTPSLSAAMAAAGALRSGHRGGDLERSLAGLHGSDRQLLELVFVTGLTTTQVAEALRTRPGRIEARISSLLLGLRVSDIAATRGAEAGVTGVPSGTVTRRTASGGRRTGPGEAPSRRLRERRPSTR